MMPDYRQSVALVSNRQQRKGASLQAVSGLERYAAPYYVVGQPNALARELISAAPPAVTRGATIGIPAIPGISGPRSVSIPAHTIPGAADVMRVAGIDPGNLPTDAAGAIKTGLQVAGQVAGKLAGPLITQGLSAIMPGVVSAVSSITASLGIGQGLGSVVPGIGNLVGLAITGLVAAVKAIIGLFKGREQCDFDPKCPDLAAEIANLSPVDALPVIARIASTTSRRLAKKAIDEDCYLEPKQGKGGKTYECIRYMLATFDQVYYFARDTPEVMGIPQIDRLLPAYQSMPTKTYTAEFRGEDRVVEHYTITEKKARHADNDVSVSAMIRKMQERRAYLVGLDSKVQEMMRTGRGHGHLRMYVVTELRRATENYAFSQTPEMEAWLRTCGTWMNAVLSAEQRRDQAIATHRAAQERRQQEIARMPAAQRKAVMDADRIAQLKMQCSEAGDKGPACDELRRMQGLPPAAPAAPSRAEGLKKLYRARNYFLYQRLQRAAQRGNATAKEIFKRAVAQPGITRANMFERVYQYLEAQANAGDKAAKFIIDSTNREFMVKLRAAQQGGATAGDGLVVGTGYGLVLGSPAA
jgi:hypothetical protein